MPETKKKILQTAKTVFLRKGLDATAMRDIAQEAGISRTSLHYYFRTKEALFRAILSEAVGEIIPQVASILDSHSGSIMGKIEQIIDTYIERFSENPLLPHFMLLEVHRDPKVLVTLIGEHANKFGNGSIIHLKQLLARKLHPRFDDEYFLSHFFVSIYGALLFPFLMQPVLDEVFFKQTPNAFSRFMQEQKPFILTMISSLFEQPEESNPDIFNNQTR